jgi:hypothetical protein
MRIRINISFSTRIPIFGSGTEIDVLFADLDPDPVMLPPTDLKICFFSLGTTTTRIRYQEWQRGGHCCQIKIYNLLQCSILTLLWLELHLYFYLNALCTCTYLLRFVNVGKFIDLDVIANCTYFIFAKESFTLNDEKSRKRWLHYIVKCGSGAANKISFYFTKVFEKFFRWT